MIIDFMRKEAMRLEIKLDYKIQDADVEYFQYKFSDNVLNVTADRERSVLYALYDYQRTQKEADNKKSRFNRRGNIYEIINDISYLKKQIQTGSEYYHNEIFFTFFLWDEVKEELKDEIRNRDLMVTLGGHSLKFLLEDMIDIDSVDDKNVSIFKEDRLQEKLIDRIILYIEDFKNINRISLWPEDISIEVNQGQEFFSNYIRFVKRLQKEINRKELDVEVEFISYNAGLSWDMLEVLEYDELLLDLNVLYAYWGRNYGNDLSKPDKDTERSLETLKLLPGASKSVTVLEYYSDFFMMSEIYPTLVKRIQSDIDYYKKNGVDGILNLNVPYFTAALYEQYKNIFDYQKTHQINNIVYSYLTFNENLDELNIDDLESLLTYEKTLASLTKYNTILFPNRLSDVKDVHYKDKVLKDLIEVRREIENIEFIQELYIQQKDICLKLINEYINRWRNI